MFQTHKYIYIVMVVVMVMIVMICARGGLPAVVGHGGRICGPDHAGGFRLRPVGVAVA